MTSEAHKTGYLDPTYSSDHLGDHLSDHLRFLHAFHRALASDRVSKVICFQQKKNERETATAGTLQGNAGKVLGTDPLDHLSPADLAKKRRTARSAEQRMKRCAAKVAAWWRSHPAQPPPSFFYPADLSRELGLPMNCIAPAMRSLGWRRLHRRMDGKARVVWVPPCSPITKRPGGRQPHQSCP